MDVRRQGLTMLVAALLAVLFGASVQYLGSFSMHPWLADVSLLSAPWLALAFVAGCTQRHPRRAALLGLVCTFAAWVGYGAMMLSPVEGAEISGPAVLGFARSQTSVIVGGVVTGPLFGWLGYRWRIDRAWPGALVTAAAFCLEPLARDLHGLPIGSTTVLVAEIAVGVLMALYVGARLSAAGPTRRPTTPR